jgi:membrane protease YdiL (CAAX protease family)
MRLLWVSLGIALELSLAGVACLLGWLFKVSLLEHFRWSVIDALLGAVASIPLLVAFLILLWWPVGPLARIQRFLEEVIRPILGNSTLLELAAISLAAGIGEELLFRGVLQELLCRWLNPWLGIALASLVFGLCHPISAVYVLITGLFGIYLGVCWVLSDNLLVVIVTHGAYDFFALVYLFRFYTAKAADTTGGSAKRVGSDDFTV